MLRAHYSKAELADVLRKVGLEKGDTIFSHVSLLNLGVPYEMHRKISPVEIVYEAILDVIGCEGTFFTPSYTYSFCKGEVFDPDETPSAVGVFSETLRKRPDFKRSDDPLFSVIGKGRRVDDYFKYLPPTSFGENSFNKRIWDSNIKVCNIGLDFFYFTPIHVLELKHNVPYRFNKVFTGNIKRNNENTVVEWEYYVRLLADQADTDCRALQDAAFNEGICVQEKVGLGSVTCTSLAPYFDFASSMLSSDPWYLACGPEISSNELQALREVG